MRSEIAKKILSETPQETKDFVRAYGHEVIARQREEIAVLKRNITPEEVEIAIDTYVRIKYDRLKNADYWDEKENPKKVEK